MRRVYHRPKPEQEKIFRINHQINSPLVFLIDENGEKLGLTPTSKALAMAEESGLDLIEVNPKISPPVAKIIDYGQFKYKKEKQTQKQKAKQKKVEIKGLRLSVRISQYDFDLRIEQAKKFLIKGDRLKVELNLKGRERQHPEKAYQIINKFIERLKKFEDLNIIVEQDLTKQSGRYNIVLINKV